MPANSDPPLRDGSIPDPPGSKPLEPQIRPKVNLAKLKKDSVRGGAVTLGFQGISILIQLTSTVVLARLLTPADYGVVTMVVALTALAGLFRDLGLSSAAIQKTDLTHAQQTNLFWLNVLMGSGLTALVAACSPLVAAFYGKPELAAVTLALSFKFLIGSLSAQHGAMLIRRMQFGRKASAALVGSIVALITSIALALKGFGYWTLVAGTLGGAVVTTAMTVWFSPFRPGLPKRRTGVREMLKFGAHITGFNLVNYFHRNLDNIVIGKVWGSAALGEYSRAYALLMFPIQAIRGPINAVAYPAMSKLKNEPEAFRRYYKQVTSLIAFLSMPLSAFLFSMSKDVVELALGSQWMGIVPLFSVLAIVGFIQPTASLRGLVLMSQGLGNKYFKWGLINALVVSIGFLVGVRWGAIGVAYSYAITTYFILPPSMAFIFAGTPVKPSDFWQSIWRPAFASSMASLLLVSIQNHAIFGQGLLTSLCLGGGIFVVAFLFVFCLLPGGITCLRNIRSIIYVVFSRDKRK